MVEMVHATTCGGGISEEYKKFISGGLWTIEHFNRKKRSSVTTHHRRRSRLVPPPLQNPQSPSPSSPMAQPVPDHPPAAAMTVAELEVAIAALPAKKDALREAFDRLAACSPFPLPFAWEDLDAHISSLQSSISLRFRQLRVLEAGRPAPAVPAPAETLDDGKTKNQDQEEEASEEEEWEEVEEVVDEEMQETDDEMDKNQEGEMNKADDNMGNDRKDDKEAREQEEEEVEEEEEIEEEEEVEEDKEEEEADDKIGNKTEDEKEAIEEEVASEKEEQDADDEVANEEQNTQDDMKVSKDKEESYEEQDTDMDEVVAKKASAVQVKGHEACGEEQEEEEESQEEEQCAKNANKTPPDASKDLVAACASMNIRKLVKFVCNSITLRQEFPVAMRHAPDAAALALHVVKLFLHNNKLKTNKVWGKCVGLIQCVPAAAAKPSVDTLEQAKRVAKDWKEMIEKPRSYGDLGVLASWGLLYFLISYDIVSEFDTNEIMRLFGTVPRKQLKNNTRHLCKGLGLADRITDLIDYLIGNGQDLDAVHLAHVFNLVDKYPPVSLLKGYLEKSKQTVMEIFEKNMTRKSQNQVIAKEVDSLRVAQNVVKQHITDSSQSSIILVEIKNLLDDYAKKKRGLANASTASTSNSQQQEKQSYKKRKKEEQEQEQEQHNGQESQQQGQQTKPGEKLEQKQNKPQQKQQKQENKSQQQHLKRPRQFTPKLPTSVTPAIPNMAHRGHFGHPPYTAMPGVHSYPTQPSWPGVQGVQFAPQLGAPQHILPFNPFYPHPHYPM
ncbi:uncharacterized protein LOC133910666 [Phragmites australis]|uniref:uncharacterized protein LOC133910666 n=1 Tax=Phragmites australis TaxID=29695 RepID=UPI002D77C1F0|nr:uncharacterized protein LOC133910666 [Phragmites australis]